MTKPPIQEMLSQVPATDDDRKRLSALRARTLQRLRTAQQYGAANAVVSRLAHDLGTALNVVAGRASLIVGGSDGAEARASATIIEQKALEMESALQRMLDFARRFPIRRQPIKLAPLVHDVLELERELAEAASVTLTCTGDAMAEAFVDPVSVELALLLLIDHVLESRASAGAPVGAIDVTFGRELVSAPRSVHAQSGSYVVLGVLDDGPAPSPGESEAALDPFPRKGTVPEGARLGLFSVARLAREHGGWMEVATEGRKTGFVVFLFETRAATDVHGSEAKAKDR